MSEAEPPRSPKPESLEAKFKLLTNLPYDKRANRKHSLVFGFVLDWYHSKYGDALASVRHVVSIIKERDPSGKGLYSGDVHSALTDLVSWGYLHQEKGSGRRASRYVPVWDLVCSVQKSPNATIDEPSVLNSPNADVRESPNATTDSVRDSMNEDPSTLTRSLDPGTGKDDIDCAPPADGLSATASAQEGFDELYTAYGVKKDKAAARRAYDKLAPPPALHASMVGAAKIWRDAAGTIERMHLSRWILEERYDEDPKGERRAKNSEPKALTELQPDNDNSASLRPSRHDQEYVIETADVVLDQFGKTLKLKMRGVQDGLCRPRSFCLEHRREDQQAKGRKEFDLLIDACKLQLSADLDTNDFVGRVIEITADNQVRRPWEPPPRVDRPPIKFVPRCSVVPKAETSAREMAKAWAAKFNDDEEDAA